MVGEFIRDFFIGLKVVLIPVKVIGFVIAFIFLHKNWDEYSQMFDSHTTDIMGYLAGGTVGLHEAFKGGVLLSADEMSIAFMASSLGFALVKTVAVSVAAVYATKIAKKKAGI